MVSKRTVYLDHSATTPTDPRVVEAMMPYFTEVYGNPSSSHRFGQRAEQAIEDARETIARILHCKSTEIVFTGCGSESDNLAIRGVAWTMEKQGGGKHLITTPIEHPAVTQTMEQLVELSGFEMTLLSIDDVGYVNASDLQEMCREDTSLVSIIYANNEVGTVQSLAELTEVAHKVGALFHTDAVQAAGQLPLNVQELGVDLLSISAHKFYGPKGVGALYIREGVDLVPSQSGGSHENGRRAGTHNTAFIVGMAEALRLAYVEQGERLQHYTQMRDELIESILQRISSAQLTGHPTQRLPTHASFVFEDIDANQLLMHLDMKGIAASSGSACKTGNPEPSTVLLALGYDPKLASSSLRLTVGQQTTWDDVAYTVDILAETIDRLERLNRELIS